MMTCGAFLDNSILSQVAELHVSVSFLQTDHCDVCGKTFQAGDVVIESTIKNKS